MKHFAYRITELRGSRGQTYTSKRIDVWQIKKNRLVHIAKREYHSESDFQAFMNTADYQKLLPRKAFVNHPSGGHRYAYPYLLEAAGIATVDYV